LPSAVAATNGTFLLLPSYLIFELFLQFIRYFSVAAGTFGLFSLISPHVHKSRAAGNNVIIKTGFFICGV
jgi:hypothetical protein